MSYTSHRLMHCTSHWTRTLKFEVRQCTGVQNPLFVACHHLRLFVVPPRVQQRFYIHITSSWKELETRRTFYVPTPARLAYYSGAFGSGGKLFSRLLCKTATTKFTVSLSVCFFRAAEFSVPISILPSRFRVQRDECRFHANKGDLSLL